jgi:hypothetical protein
MEAPTWTTARRENGTELHARISRPVKKAAVFLVEDRNKKNYG